jgi:hypothetical protein
MTLASDRTRRRRSAILPSGSGVATSTHATSSASAPPESNGASFATMASLDGQLVELRRSTPWAQESMATIIENEDNITMM